MIHSSLSPGETQVLGVVLCGGKSTRMGRDKATLPFPNVPCPPPPGTTAGSHNTAGKTFFDIATERLQRQALPVAISGHCSIEHSFCLIKDKVAEQGPMQGVMASLEFAKANQFQACLFTPIDVPFLTDGGISSLIKAWNQKQELTVAFSDRIEPLIAIYPTSLVESLCISLANDQRSLMNWVKQNPLQRVAIPKSSCRNINRPTDPF